MFWQSDNTKHHLQLVSANHINCFVTVDMFLYCLHYFAHYVHIDKRHSRIVQQELEKYEIMSTVTDS